MKGVSHVSPRMWACLLIVIAAIGSTNAQCSWATYDQTFASWRATATPDSEGAYRVENVRLLVQGPLVDLSAYSIKIFNGGALVFANQDITMRVKNIIIEDGGALFVGNEACAYTAQAVISLTGAANDPALSSPTGQYSGFPLPQAGEPAPGPYGNRVLAVGTGGTLSLRGNKGVARFGGVSWTRLAANAPIGATSITLARSVDWQEGDRIVVTTSDFEPDHSEEVTISSVSGGGTVVNFSPALQFPHWGKMLNYSRPVDIRAEVALLSRNIRIESADRQSTYGGHTIFRRGITSVKLEGVELAYLGQGGFIMRYPLHYHIIVDAPIWTFVRDCSIVQSWNRWVVLHGSRNVMLERNVGYMSFGHGYYIEDGYETNNLIDSNIGITARDTHNQPTLHTTPAMQSAFWNPSNVRPLISSDQGTPSIFWITNAFNTITNNVAVGATACGRCYWFMGRQGRGASAQVTELTNAPFSNGIRAPIYNFTGNVAHACFLGIDTIPPQTSGGDCAPGSRTLPHNTAEPDFAPQGYDFIFPTVDGSGSASKYAVGIIDSATVYRNRGSSVYSAVWLRPFWWWLRNSAIVDNGMGGVTMVSGGDPSGVVEGYWGASTNTVYVGFSEFADQWQPYGSTANREGSLNTVTLSTYPSGLFAERRGHQFYDGPAHISNCQFHNFNPRISEPMIRMPGSIQPVIWNNTAIGWFLPNVFLYPAGFTSEQLSFVNTTIADAMSLGLLDGDKQTFLLDLDGSLTGFADATSINNYAFHRGPVWQVECLSAETCITSPYSYVNAHFIVRQHFLLALKGGAYHLDFTPGLPSTLPLFIRLLYSYATSDYVDFSICVGTGLNAGLMSVQYGQMVNNNPTYNVDPDAAFTASPATAVTWSYSSASGRLTVRVANHQPKNDHCFPAGACVLNTATGKCAYDASVASVTNCGGAKLAECNAVCEKYGNTYPECPHGGCPTVRIAFGQTLPANPTCTKPAGCLNSALASVQLQGTDEGIDPVLPTQCTGQCDSTVHYDPPQAGCTWPFVDSCEEL